MATILVVDDRAINREFLSALLGYTSHAVIEAADGSEALACVHRTKPDLIITDVMMPVMDGLDLVRQLRADATTADIPVIFYTATYRVHEAREMARVSGVQIVLPKPSEPQVILDAVASVLGPQAIPAATATQAQVATTATSALNELLNLQQRIYAALDSGVDADSQGPHPPPADSTGRPLGKVHALSLRLAAVLELGLTLAAEREPQRLLDQFCRGAQDIIGSRYAGVIVIESGRSVATRWTASGLDAAARADLGALDGIHGFMSEVLRSTEPICLLMLGGDASRAGLPPSHPAIEALLAAPMRSPTETLGILYFADKINGVKFDEEDEQFAATLAAQLALTYGNLEMYEGLQQHAGELQIEVIERKRIAEELRESETRFRQVLENLREAVFLFDPVASRTLYVSPAFETIWQMGRELIYADSQAWAHIVHPEDRQRVSDSWVRSRLSGHIDNEYRIVRADASVRWVNVRGFPVRDANGNIHRIVGIAEDITERRRAQEAIVASEARYRQLFDANPLPMWVYDLQTLVFLAVNSAAVAHYGYSREQFLAMSIADIRPEQDLPALRESVKLEVAGIDHSGIWRHRKRDGTLIRVEITSHVVDFSGRRAKLVLAHDVTERFEQEHRIARLNRIRAVIGGISSAMLRLRDRDELLREACRVAATEGVFPLAWVSLIDPQTHTSSMLASYGGDAPLIEILRQAARETFAGTARWELRASGDSRPVVANDLGAEPRLVSIRDELTGRGFHSAAAFPLFAAGRVVAVLALLAGERDFFDEQEIALLSWLAADLSFALEHIEKSQRLDYLAYYDDLTELPNAKLFRDRLGQFVQTARQTQGKVCAIVVDLERFTQVNETLGRGTGDELLRQVGARFRHFLIEPYALGRIGADTFAAASPGDDELVATKLRDRMFEALIEPFCIEGREVRITAQAGIALFPADGDDEDSVFKNAESALKLAKSSGERYAYYSSEMNARIAQRLALEEQLRVAVEMEQFVIYYQPRVDMINGELVGAEALIRWQHPIRGLVAPLAFIAAAEQCGLIVPMGSWVIDAVCAQQAVWLAMGLSIVPVALNLSSVQFEKSDLLKTVTGALAKHALDGRHLGLELTESAVMNDPAAATTTLEALRRLGVSLSLDDFGTGYSSLAHLKRFPFDSVKIDRSFVTDITINAEDAAIATAIIAMAHRLDLKVVAEGVETQGQFNYLRAQACDEMQGFLFGPAVPGGEFEAQLRTGKRLALPAVETVDRQTLLVVDDEQGIRAALTRILRRDGYRILTAASGLEGLELLAVNSVQVIISDQRMPEMSGTKFLHTVKQLYPETMRIILSGYTDLEVVTDAVNRGSVFKFLTKPWDDELLREQVRDAFRRYRPERAPNQPS